MELQTNPKRSCHPHMKHLPQLKSIRWSNVLLWTIYIALLIVLLPHTAWAFTKFEPSGSQWVAWAAAFAFEAAIAALTHKLTGAIERTARIRKRWRRFSAQYLNVYAIGLYVTVGVSALANFAHAVEFGQSFVIFTSYRVPPLVYSVAFGGILPFCSLLFARILANVQYIEVGPDEELEAAKTAERTARKETANLRRQLRSAEQKATLLQERLTDIEHRFAELRQRMKATEHEANRLREQANAAAALFAGNKQDRIIAVHQRWPGLKNSAIAILVSTSPGHVSETLSAARNSNGKGLAR